MGGIFQPLFDGLKLLTKEFLFPQFTRTWGFVFAPIIYFILMILLWRTNAYLVFWTSHNLGGFFLLCVLGGRVYTSLLTGVNSFSKFALLGGIRSAAQTISYEICLAFFVFCFLVIWGTLSLRFSGILFLPSILIWFFIVLAETNRAPFDFAEGERELISGFNIEFGRAGFVFLFLGEYGIILFLSFLRGVFFGRRSLLIVIVIRFCVVLVRRTLPRFRYDFLMGIFWIYLLPITIFLFCCFALFKFFKSIIYAFCCYQKEIEECNFKNIDSILSPRYLRKKTLVCGTKKLLQLKVFLHLLFGLIRL